MPYISPGPQLTLGRFLASFSSGPFTGLMRGSATGESTRLGEFQLAGMPAEGSFLVGGREDVLHHRAMNLGGVMDTCTLIELMLRAV